MKHTSPAHLSGLVLAVQPTNRGYAWVLFEEPHLPVAWAIAHAKLGRNERLIARFRRLLDKYRPAVLVLEAFAGKEVRRGLRVQQLCQRMVDEARASGIETPIFDRETIQAVFAAAGAQTRPEIARVIAERIDAFSHRLPPPRKIGSSDDARQALFDAAALALTYFAFRGDLDVGP